MPTEGQEEFNPLEETFALLHRQLDVLERLWRGDVTYTMTVGKEASDPVTGEEK